MNQGLENSSSEFKKNPSSGALGTIVGEPNFTGDVRGRVFGVPQKMKIEAKVGYGGAKQMTVYKEWFDKIAEEAAQDYSIPLVACKYSGARGGVQKFIAMDIDIFLKFMNLISQMQEDLDTAYEKVGELEQIINDYELSLSMCKGED